MLLTHAATVSSYDFRRPNKLNREHVRALQIVGETFSRQFTTVLSTSLRTMSSVSLEDVVQKTYDEYIRALPNPTLLTVLDLAPLKGIGMLNLPTEITMSIVDRLLGGNGSGRMPRRPPTEIELRLLRNLLERVLRELSYAFESLSPVTPTIVRSETNPQFAQLAASTDMIVVSTFTLRIGDMRSEASLGIPFTALQPALDSATGPGARDSDGRNGDIRTVVEASLQSSTLEVRVRFDEISCTSRELAALAPGDVLPLGHSVHDPLTVEVEGRPRFLATAGTKGKRVACLITDVTGDH